MLLFFLMLNNRISLQITLLFKLIYYLFIFVIFFRGIAMSRIIDNQHHASDVIAGMVLGTLIAVMYILRAIPRYSRVLTHAAYSREVTHRVVAEDVSSDNASGMALA